MVFINQPLSATMPAISADAMLDRGDLKGQAVWKRVVGGAPIRGNNCFTG